jgi:hypothetical protein
MRRMYGGCTAEFGRDWCAAQGMRDVVAFGMAGAYAWNISHHAF